MKNVTVFSDQFLDAETAFGDAHEKAISANAAVEQLKALRDALRATQAQLKAFARFEPTKLMLCCCLFALAVVIEIYITYDLYRQDFDFWVVFPLLLTGFSILTSELLSYHFSDFAALKLAQSSVPHQTASQNRNAFAKQKRFSVTMGICLTALLTGVWVMLILERVHGQSGTMARPNGHLNIMDFLVLLSFFIEIGTGAYALLAIQVFSLRRRERRLLKLISQKKQEAQLRTLWVAEQFARCRQLNASIRPSVEVDMCLLRFELPDLEDEDLNVNQLPTTTAN